jgi:hypothetical protein
MIHVLIFNTSFFMGISSLLLYRVSFLAYIFNILFLYLYSHHVSKMDAPGVIPFEVAKG